LFGPHFAPESWAANETDIENHGQFLKNVFGACAPFASESEIL
jgi:hypothetical protein